jgi:pimeloyl-ACP methyl ester carboxylesterase
MLPTLADMARDHRVIAPDLPGFGESAKPIRSYHAAYYAEWVLGLMDGLGIERADLIGNSMGGRVAIEAGLVAPERFGRLALLAPSPAFIQRRQFVRIVRFLRPEMALLPLPIPTRRVVGGIKALFARPERLDGACIGRPRTSSSGSSTRPADASRSSRRRGRSISRSRGDRRGSGIDSPRCRCRRSSCGGSATAWSRRRSHVTWTACSPPPPRSYWATAGTSRSSSFPNVRTTWCVSSSELRKHPRKPLHGI